MSLHDALRELPPELRLRSLVNGEVKTAAEWLDSQRDEGLAYEAKLESYYYGEKHRWVIVAPDPFRAVVYREAK